MHRSAPLLLLLVIVMAAPPLASASSVREQRAERLVTAARVDLAADTFERRRLAIQRLEDATQIVSNRPDWDLLLARTYVRCGFLGLARRRFERVRAYAPEDADACLGLGWTWRQDWLKYLETSSRDEAIRHLQTSVRLSRNRADAAIMLTPLLVDAGDLEGADASAQQAIAAEPTRPDAMVAAAFMAYRMGRLAPAESLYSRAIPRLPRPIRDRFEDIRPVASERDTALIGKMWPQQAASFRRRFWRRQDPDPVTAENEAQLEYWSRAANAYLLYYDSRRGAWDERGEMFVRYGPPARQSYNDVGEALTLALSPGMPMPMNVLMWDYPELGMRIKLQDRQLNGFYQPEIVVGSVMSGVIEPLPDPDSLARHPELVGIGEGRGVFHTLPPTIRPLPVAGTVAGFESERGPRLLASVEAPGDPGDSLVATWVIRDSAEVEIARDSRSLSPSACDPTELQVAEFATDLPPGDYRVGLAVAGRRRTRGIFVERFQLGPLGTALSLSDLVVTCGTPDAASFDPTHPAVRLEPNPAARVARGNPLTAYFEINHLRQDSEGKARFDLEYQVRSRDRDARIWIQRLFSPRPAPNPIRASRTEEQTGSLRRQFLSVPLESLPPGNYRLEIHVSDTLAGTEASGAADFSYALPAPRAAAAGPGSRDGTEGRQKNPPVSGATVR